MCTVVPGFPISPFQTDHRCSWQVKCQTFSVSFQWHLSGCWMDWAASEHLVLIVYVLGAGKADKYENLTARQMGPCISKKVALVFFPQPDPVSNYQKRYRGGNQWTRDWVVASQWSLTGWPAYVINQSIFIYIVHIVHSPKTLVDLDPKLIKLYSINRDSGQDKKFYLTLPSMSTAPCGI